MERLSLYQNGTHETVPMGFRLDRRFLVLFLCIYSKFHQTTFFPRHGIAIPWGWYSDSLISCTCHCHAHHGIVKWKHFSRYWPFVRGVHRCPMNSPHKGQWRGTLMFSLICARINCWVNNREAGELRRRRARYDVIVMIYNVMSSYTVYIYI